VDVDIDVALNEEVVDSLDVFVFAGVGCSKDGADSNSILIAEVDALLGVDYIAFSCAVDVLLLDVEVATRFLTIVSTNPCKSIRVVSGSSGWYVCTDLPADLYSRVHDHVRLVVGLALSLALVLPELLHGEYSQLRNVSS
jgi:hypothetical protein